MGGAFEALSLADRTSPLDAPDQQLLATAAYVTGRLPECVTALRRASEAHAQAGRPRRAARAMFWMAFTLGNQGDDAQAAGWLGRAAQLLGSQPPDCAEQGLLHSARAFRHNRAGDTHRHSSWRRRRSRLVGVPVMRMSGVWR